MASWNRCDSWSSVKTVGYEANSDLSQAHHSYHMEHVCVDLQWLQTRNACLISLRLHILHCIFADPNVNVKQIPKENKIFYLEKQALKGTWRKPYITDKRRYNLTYQEYFAKLLVLFHISMQALSKQTNKKTCKVIRRHFCTSHLAKEISPAEPAAKSARGNTCLVPLYSEWWVEESHSLDVI